MNTLKLNKLAIIIPAVLFSASINAASLVNNSSKTLSVSNGLLAPNSGTTLAAGSSMDIPSSWGDNQHLFLHIKTEGMALCGNKYGVAKLSATDNHAVTQNLACEIFNGEVVIEDPVDTEDPVIEDPVDNDGPVIDNPVGTILPTDPVPVRAKGNGTWLYDAQFTDGPTGHAYTKAGLWAKQLNEYNESARSVSKVNQFFTYGGNLEMYCRGSGESSYGTECNSKNMLVLYYPPSFFNANLTLAQLGDSGYHSTQYYKAAADTAFSETNTRVQIIPILDGRVDNAKADDYLNAFNDMNKSEAELFADNVARVYCADNAVAGVQFDIEPFNYEKPGQKYFYDQIAKNFAGENKNAEGEGKFGCKNADHPEGRSFSMFTFPSRVIPSLVTAMDKYKNGYAIYSLYDLPETASVGPVNSPADYYDLVMEQIHKAESKGAYFQLAIPAAASVHEFEALNGVATGYKQVDYVKSAINAINDSGVRDNPKFLGIALWGWSKYMSYPPHSNNTYTPSTPPQDVLDYLQDNL